MATGFHGAHVIIGSIFLIVCLFRAMAGQFTPTQHLGFEFAAWYWHFVDVVWLFLFACIYVWGRDRRAPAEFGQFPGCGAAEVRAPLIRDRSARTCENPGSAALTARVTCARRPGCIAMTEKTITRLSGSIGAGLSCALSALRQRQAVRGFLTLRPRCDVAGSITASPMPATGRRSSSCFSPASSWSAQRCDRGRSIIRPIGSTRCCGCR